MELRTNECQWNMELRLMSVSENNNKHTLAITLMKSKYLCGTLNIQKHNSTLCLK